MTDTKQFRKLGAASSSETPVLWTDAPAIAASGTEMLNDTDTAKQVRINAGTVSAVAVGPPGATVAITGMTTSEWIRVRPHHAIKLTYSVVPTSMVWMEE